jgi:uncharacterized membrane protein YagU involved in acid resistance
MLKPIAIATAVAGTLDIVFAMILTVLFGREIGNMLRYVGSGPLPEATEMGASGAILGLLVHFALMAIMAAVYVLAARRIRALVEKPILWGVLYGLATYVAMNWLVVPMRFDTPLPPSPLSMAAQLFAHVVLVGIPIALITARLTQRTT